MTSLKPQILSREQIWEEVENFRQRHINPPDTVPVPIDDIIEFELNIQPQPIPHLLEEYDIDGFLSGDLKVLYIDQNIYESPRQENRRRFTYAHEAGHLWLHKAQIEECHFQNPREWIEFRNKMPEDDLKWSEYQGYEFAGRLLVPRNSLVQELNRTSDLVMKYRTGVPDSDDDLLMEYLAGFVNNVFRVSEDVIYRRIKHEKIWDLLSFNS